MSQTKTRTVVLTGGASGIGAAVLERLRANQHRVFVLDVRRPQNPDVTFLPCDLGDADQLEQTIEALGAQLARELHSRGQGTGSQVSQPTIDALINVAGVATLPNENHTVAINFLALRALTEALLPSIKPGGSVVNVASTAGWKWRDFLAEITPLLDTNDYRSGEQWLTDNPQSWRDAPYHFSKRCAAAYTYRAAKLALAHNVRVNCVNPGVTETRLSPEFRGIVGDALYDWGVKQIGRPGTPADIAEVIDFLAVGECRWLNGQEIVVDGGYIAGLIGGWIDPSKAPA